jgi:hypothetical protein
MKTALFFAGIFIGIYTYVFITTQLVYISDIPEVPIRYPLGPVAMSLVTYSIIAVIPAHFILVRRAYKKHNFEFAIAAPFFIIPYMLGAAVQALIL